MNINKKLFFPGLFFLITICFFAGWQTRGFINVEGLQRVNKDNKETFINDLEESIKLQGEWFVKNQKEAGDFVYELNTETGEQTEGYNIVRQAGAMYSLGQLYKKNKNKDIRKALEKGFDFFENLAEEQDGNKDSKAITYNNDTRSNTTALLLLALIEYMETDEAHKDEQLEFAQSLANYLVSTQLESGGYIYKYPDQESDYNNGETFYALVRMYRLDPKADYLQSVTRAAEYFLKTKYANRPLNLSFYAWGMAGFSHLYKVEAYGQYWQFMKNYTDKYLDSRGAAVENYLLNECVTAPKGNLGVYLEGITHVAWIAKDKDSDFYFKLKGFTEKSLDYLLTLQINGPRSERSSAFNQIKGGICYDYDCKTQRIDIVHHNLSAMYLYLTLVR